jgi:hypothetical protein
MRYYSDGTPVRKREFFYAFGIILLMILVGSI